MTSALVLAAVTAAMQLGSSAFSSGAAIPQEYMARDCGGANRTPPLHWSGAPPGTKSFALVLHDPDAPVSGGFDHWVVYDLPASARSLAAGAALPPEELGRTTLGETRYYGPCPPPGPAHRYAFTLYALDVAHAGGARPLDARTLRDAIAGHVLAKATLEATASHP